jgi:uncharacterized protein (TIGR00297 family)
LPSWEFTLWAPVVAAIVAALVETLPIRLDDNLSVPAAAGAVLWGASLVTADSLARSIASMRSDALPAIAVNGVASLVGWRMGTVSGVGALVGAIIGTLIYTCTGVGGWALLFASFLVATVTTRMGLERKDLLGIAEERKGRRGAGNALANCAVAVGAALMAVVSGHRDSALIALVAALTAGGSDTVASEIGKAWGRRTYLVPTWRPVKPGTSGAISLEGTAAGLVAAFALAALARALGLIVPDVIWIIAVAATTGALLESALGATLEPRGIVDNDVLNFINTSVAALVALALAGRLR